MIPTQFVLFSLAGEYHTSYAFSPLMGRSYHRLRRTLPRVSRRPLFPFCQLCVWRAHVLIQPSPSLTTRRSLLPSSAYIFSPPTPNPIRNPTPKMIHLRDPTHHNESHPLHHSTSSFPQQHTNAHPSSFPAPPMPHPLCKLD